jgi:hypothetical protein
MDASHHEIRGGGQLAHLSLLHLAVHLVEPGTERLVLAGAFDVLGHADGFERPGGVVEDLGTSREDRPLRGPGLLPESARRLVIPLRSSAAAAATSRASEASWANSAMASAVGPLGTPPAQGALTSLATDFGEGSMAVAAEQRLIDPLRTSPAANNPGWLVSRGKGERDKGHRSEPGSARTSAPVRR